MKTTFFTYVLVLIASALYGQTYEFGVLSGGGLLGAIKSEGTIEITDSTVIITSIVNGATTNINYKITNISTTQQIYVTDGAQTHQISIISESGKIKGYSYEKLILFKLDPQWNANMLMLYYAKVIVAPSTQERNSYPYSEEFE